MLKQNPMNSHFFNTYSGAILASVLGLGAAGCAPGAVSGFDADQQLLVTAKPRKEWVNGDPASQCSDSMLDDSPRYRITVHHTAGEAATGGEAEVAQMNTILSTHYSRGAADTVDPDEGTKWWCDVGYHFVIAPTGEVYEGRPIDFMGAHTAFENDGNVGIAVMGDYRTQAVPPAVRGALRRVIKELRADYPNIEFTDPSCSEYDGDSDLCLRGHREHKNNRTACPGNELMAVVQEIRGDIAEHHPEHDPYVAELDDEVAPGDTEYTCATAGETKSFNQTAWDGFGGKCFDRDAPADVCSGVPDNNWICVNHPTYGLVTGPCRAGAGFQTFSTAQWAVAKCFACNNPNNPTYDSTLGLQADQTHTGSANGVGCVYNAAKDE